MAESTFSLLGEVDLHLFNEGTHSRLHQRLGAHPARAPDGTPGTYFAVWAPDAASVAVVGDFNGWSPTPATRLEPRGESGIWERFIPGIRRGDIYKYAIRKRDTNERLDKADPFARFFETPPRSASVVWTDDYAWGDAAWTQEQKATRALSTPVSIYEVHFGSWRRVPEEGDRSLSYREAAPLLAAHVRDLGFTHVELLPLTEHPFYGSWGYQTSGYFAPTSRYGPPEDFKYFVDYLHRSGIGVILDWVPSHFPTDAHLLGRFDGTSLYEHADPRQGHHPDWDTYIFNYGRNEVRSFLLSSAAFWLEEFHIDGLRVDAVASMLYLDYSRKEGEWIPNQYGGRENIEAIEFLRQLNGEIGKSFPGVQTYAEESTSWPMVSRPPEVGGLGFHFKWDMGWMHDTLSYLSRECVHRKYHHNEITFRAVYAFSENFVLPLSHDEVVHGKRSLLEKMPGDDWQKFANLRLLYGYMFAQPGKKLLFMGAEIAQRREWDHDSSLDWHVLDTPAHAGIKRWVSDLNRTYKNTPALFAKDCDPTGFEWIDGSDHEHSVLAFARLDSSSKSQVIVACNFTPVPRHGYRIGAPAAGTWREVLNSDAEIYGGSGQGNSGEVRSDPEPMHGRRHSVALTLPPLGIVFLELDDASIDDD